MRPHVLIVDDSIDQQKLMSLVFKMVDPNLRVDSAENGNVVLEKLCSDPNSRPDVIFLDLRMPGLSGIEMIKEMKSDPHLKYIPICAFSNGKLQKDICECYALGASFYFQKPCGLEALKDFATNFRYLWFEIATLCSTEEL